MNAALKEGGDKVTTSSAGKRKQQLLLLVQFALAFVALTTSTLIILSLYRLDKQDAGYASEQILAVTMSINRDLTESTQAHMQNFWPQLLARTETIPGVTGVTFLSGAPLLQDVAYLRDTQLEIDDLAATSPNPTFNTKQQFVSASYFTVMNIPLLQGSLFDNANATPTVIVNANLAEKYFPEGDALGKRIGFPGTDFGWTITGVVGNIRARGLDQEETEAIYIHRRTPSDGLNLYVKSTGNLAELANTIAGIVYEIDPRQSIGSAEPLEETRATWLAPAKLRGTLIFLFGALALIVTLSGVIGVVSCNIAQRVREIGIHMAIGATPARVMKMFVADGLKIYLGGLLAGLVLMLVAAPSLSPLLYETDVFTPEVYFVSTVVLTFAVLLALIVPARAASGMSPAEALHCE